MGTSAEALLAQFRAENYNGDASLENRGFDVVVIFGHFKLTECPARAFDWMATTNTEPTVENKPA